MSDIGAVISRHSLSNSGVISYKRAYWNLSAPALYEHTLEMGSGAISEDGALVVSTGAYTGRSPNDKFIVHEDGSADKVWWGEVNVAIDEENFQRLHQKLITHFGGRDLYVQDLFAGAAPEHRLGVRVVSESPW
ncbi:MAG: phosphoenolpyruvate carboxykinase (ATP), partial [Kiloniellales bacterium]|nr:phosphoenolpyruvate carboxykinase (ATP) [Kiloniellales bacterium]